MSALANLAITDWSVMLLVKFRNWSVSIRKDLQCHLAIRVQVHVDACFLLTQFTGESDGCGLDPFKCAVCF